MCGIIHMNLYAVKYKFLLFVISGVCIAAGRLQRVSAALVSQEPTPVRTNS